MLRLYGSAGSRRVRTLWMLGELGLPYDHKDYLPRSAGTMTQEYRALNPNGFVPTIDEDDFVLSELMARLSPRQSSAIWNRCRPSKAGPACAATSIERTTFPAAGSKAFSCSPIANQTC